MDLSISLKYFFLINIWPKPGKYVCYLSVISMTGAAWQRGWGRMLFSFQFILCGVKRMPSPSSSPSKRRNLKHFLPPLRKGQGKGGIWDVNKGSLAIVEPGSCEARTDKPKITCIVLTELSLKGLSRNRLCENAVCFLQQRVAVLI